ncbi:hypothetical protein Z968_07820 [Clostridium novyi A str. 4552]|uniref:DUF4652 domain-containing protein n=1 Tax=Clostridium novyi A str. 4552 TaxID=1444289 RepID=A0A0A0I3A1_CLONO|nr:DUF4652 domain-containing protein [Clostridium novyi]KGM95884.1 hypothetical protein Z968_07820 [Clostridium novyi A str. 4552]
MKLNELKLRKKAIYFLCASMTISSMVFTGCSKEGEEINKKDVKIETNANEKNSQKENVKNTGEKVNIEKNSSENGNIKKQDANSKKMFLKKELGKNAKADFATKWKNSKNNKFSACIEGKGPDAEEEGVGKIYIRNLDNKSKWALEIDQDEQKSTPKYIEWFDNNNLMVIIGGAHGTVSQGGNLYKVNIETGQATEIYNTKDNKKQVISASKKGDKINLQILVYKNDDLIESHKETKTITVK